MQAVDFHCDTLSALLNAQRSGKPLSFRHNDLHIDLDKLQRGNYMLQCFAAFVDLDSADRSPLEIALEEYDCFFRIMREYPDEIAQVKTWADIEENRRKGRISALMTMEEGGCCLGEPALLRVFYQLGVRIMTLTWNHENGLAYPNIMPRDRANGAVCRADTIHGLKEKGFEFVNEMENLGMIVDVSHLSDAGFCDVCRISHRPFIASHSNARAVSGHVRNLTDDMLRAIAEHGGLTGINFCGAFLAPDSTQPASTAALMVDHIDHIRKVGGLDMIALGSDYDGIGGVLELADCSYMPLLEAELHRRGYSDDAIEAVFCGNALRLLKEFL